MIDKVRKLGDPSVDNPVSGDQLCPICSTISFNGALFSFCDKHAPQGLRSQGLIKLGTVQSILENVSCPACRLLSSCISSYGEIILPSSRLQINPRYYLEEGISDQNISSGRVGIGSRKWINIQTCSHGIRPTNGKRLDIRLECEAVDIGVLLPATRLHHWEELELFSGNFEGHYIHARKVSPTVDTALIRKWINDCEMKHSKACETRILNLQDQQDLRLIDVKARRLVIGDLGWRYVALSYVWGRNTKPVLTKATLPKYLRAGNLAEENIPSTIWDAMGLVADLGERYLWVDSVCIIQDDSQDKKNTLPIMGEIYNHAFLVIVAAVENANSGLPGVGLHQRHWSRPTENIRGMDFTTGQPQVFQKLQTTVWNTRGWTFQEAQLARRALVFTECQVYWNCRQSTWYEDRFTEFLDDHCVPSNISRDPLLGMARLNISQEKYSKPLICPLWEYCLKVQAFSTRSFSNRDDTFWAFVGTLKSLAPKFPKGYIWGIPKDYLDAALLWETDCSCHPQTPLVVPTDAERKWQEFEIPSWCWISKGSKVWYDSCGTSIKTLVEWHDSMKCEEYRPLYDCQSCKDAREAYLEGLIFPPHAKLARGIPSEFARLHFTAQTTTLRLHTVTEKIKSPECFITSAAVSPPSGKHIGSIRIPASAFTGKSEMLGEFILLSSKVGDCVPESSKEYLVEQGHGLEHKEPEYNIMLIRWSDDKKIAYRVAWTKVSKRVWEECETQSKSIVLG